jgi:hypothetical protein
MVTRQRTGCAIRSCGRKPARHAGGREARTGTAGGGPCRGWTATAHGTMEDRLDVGDRSSPGGLLDADALVGAKYRIGRHAGALYREFGPTYRIRINQDKLLITEPGRARTGGERWPMGKHLRHTDHWPERPQSWAERTLTQPLRVSQDDPKLPFACLTCLRLRPISDQRD